MPVTGLHLQEGRSPGSRVPGFLCSLKVKWSLKLSLGCCYYKYASKGLDMRSSAPWARAEVLAMPGPNHPNIPGWRPEAPRSQSYLLQSRS